MTVFHSLTVENIGREDDRDRLESEDRDWKTKRCKIRFIRKEKGYREEKRRVRRVRNIGRQEGS